jgi:hypothetical protein
MSHKSHSNSKSKSKSHCKNKCFCLRVPYVPNPSYNVEILSENPLNPHKMCKCCHKVKQTPFKQTVVMTPIPVAPFY